MQKFSALALLSAVGILALFSLASCTTTGVPGEGVTSEGYSAPDPVSPVERTENMRNEYRDWMVR